MQEDNQAHSDAIAFFEHLIQAIWSGDTPPEITSQVDDRGLYLVVHAKTGLGQLIGRGGESANAIRTIMHLYEQKYGVHVSVRFGEKKV
jgi:predicted RNA-binding protein YlqC (UPF0109 family)